MTSLKCNGFVNPIQIDNKQPEFSWVIKCQNNGSAQSAYNILVQKASSDEIVWNSGIVESDKNLHVVYTGSELQSHTRYKWKVKYWNENKQESLWSDTAFFETGYMGENWQGQWIGYDEEIGEPYDKSQPFYCADDFDLGQNNYYLPPPPYLRNEYVTKGPVKYAKMYVAALGLCEVQINGNKVGTSYFDTGLSDYNKTVYSKAYDVTKMLENGNNAVGIILADGWFAGYIGLNSREWFGSCPRVLMEIHVHYESGKLEKWVTNSDWKASYGPIKSSDIFQGEVYDANCELGNWSQHDFNADDWKNVEVGHTKPLIPVAHIGVPVVKHGQLSPKSMKTIKNKSEKIIQIQFDRYVVGVLKILVKGAKNSVVQINHSEWLADDERLYLRGNRSAKCEDKYVLCGNGKEEFKPKFTYHGFQFAQLVMDENVELLDVVAIEISSAIYEPTFFNCSNEVVNKVFNMINNTQKGNRFEVPTDCCARDERLGWGMEGNHFCYAMTYMSNQEAFIRKWLTEIWDSQRENGGLEAIAPALSMKDIEQFVGDLQSNHGIHMIYTLYKIYGDTQVIKKYFVQLEKFFYFTNQNSDRDIRFATSGDWLGILEKTGHTDVLHGYGDCSPAIIGTSHYAMIVEMMIELCNAIGKQKEASKYQALHSSIKKQFMLNFIQRDASIRNARQGDYLIALAAGLIPKEHENQAVEHLCCDLMKDGHVNWKGGTPTTPYFLKTLKKYGKTKIANQFICSEKYPSIGYMAKKGASTIWERWDAIYEDGSLHPQAMNALSHIGYTVVADYIIGGIGGIEPAKAGYKQISINPQITKEITSAKTIYQCGYGEIESQWQWKNGVFNLKCKIPANTTASITLPWDKAQKFNVVKGEAKEIANLENVVTFNILSGAYEFETQLENL